MTASGPTDGEARSRRRPLGGVPWGLISIGIATLSFAPGVVLLLIVPLVSPLLPLSGVACGGLDIVRSNRVGPKRHIIVPIAGVFLSTLSAAVHLMFWPSVFAHELELRRIERALCRDDVPPGATAMTCQGAISNPSNGNQCGYSIDVVLQTTAALESLVDFYNRSALPEYRHGGFFVPPMQSEFDAEKTGSDTRRVTVLVIGDEGMDLRCM